MTLSAETLTLQKLFSLGLFDASRIQRTYQWQDTQWRELLTDLEAALRKAGRDPDPDDIEQQITPEDAAEADDADVPTSNPDESAQFQKVAASKTSSRIQHYFLGPMVLQPRERLKEAYYIFDGQQRFTTLSILLSALRDQLSDGPPEQWLELQELLRTTDSRRVARLTIDTRGKALAAITGGLHGTRFDARIANKSNTDRLMYRAADYFRRRTAAWSDKKRRAFVSFLRTNVHVTVTYIEDRKIAELAYQAVNSRGLALQIADTIKGHIVQVVGAESAMRANEVADKWEQLRQRASGKFDHFLRAVDFLMFREPRDNDFGEALLERFDGEADADLAYRWVRLELPGYLEDFLPILAHHHLPMATGVHIPLRQLSFLGWKEWQSVAMALINKHGADQDELQKQLAKLQRACYVMHLLHWSDYPSSRCKALANALSELQRGGNPFRPPGRGRPGALWFGARLKAQARGALVAEMPDDEFHGPIVRWLETLQYGGELPLSATDDRSVEHVLPRAHGGTWVDSFPDEDERERCKNQLGNFCLLPKDVDAQLRNAGWAIKKADYLKKAPTCLSAQEVAGHDEWNAAAVDARTARLARTASTALGLGQKVAPSAS
jgi:hypothetical protein